MRIHVCEVAIRGQIRVAASSEKEAVELAQTAIPSLAFRPLSTWETEAKVVGGSPAQSSQHTVTIERPKLTVHQ